MDARNAERGRDGPVTSLIFPTYNAGPPRSVQSALRSQRFDCCRPFRNDWSIAAVFLDRLYDFRLYGELLHNPSRERLPCS